jgi:hypothetical protein
MKRIMLCVIGLMAIPLLVACSPGQLEMARTVAPETTAAFENDGLLAAVDTFTGHFVIQCDQIDGNRVQIDVAADAFNGANTIEKAREVRKDICDRFIAANALTGAFLGDPVPIEGELTPPKAPPPG